ncbi:MAG: response regulator [Planctomycetaceae bacterium]
MNSAADRTILIADDDRNLVYALSERCRRLGLNVLTAHDAYTALSLAKSAVPDMICLDVEMPAGNGLSVGEMLTSDAASRFAPIIILTGRNDPETIVRCHNMCIYYVEKCDDVWSRIEPLLQELLAATDGVSIARCAPSTPAETPFADLCDDKAPACGHKP